MTRRIVVETEAGESHCERCELQIPSGRDGPQWCRAFYEELTVVTVATVSQRGAVHVQAVYRLSQCLEADVENRARKRTEEIVEAALKAKVDE